MTRPARSSRKDVSGDKIRTFYPFVGSLSHYTSNLTAVLRYLDSQNPSRSPAFSWVASEFGTSQEFARKVLDALKALGLTTVKGRHILPTALAREFVQHQDVQKVGQLLAAKVTGMQEILELLAGAQSIEKAALFDACNKLLLQPIPRNQFEHRINWLRGLGFVDIVAKNYYATDLGLRLAAQTRASLAKDEESRLAVSHADLEDRLVIIGEFFEFEAAKRPSINAVLPSYALKLSHGDRQLDCLWVRYVHFGGKIKFPIEVHLGGNMADTLDRLETVSEFVQKAILVTDEEREKQVIDRLKVKRSRLLDKLVIVSVEDIYKVVEATSILRSFTSKVFSD
jgi:hypothetical protein